MLTSRVPSRLLRVALTLASLALTLHVVTVVAFDPGRPARVAEAMLATPEGRDLAADAVTSQVRRFAPSVPAATATTIGRRVVTDPALHDALRAAGDRQPGTPAASAVSNAVRASVARANPAVARLLGARAGSGLSPVPVAAARTLDDARDLAERARGWLLTAAAGFGVAALALARRRTRMLQRIGRVAMGVSLVQVLLWFAVPNVLLPLAQGPWPVVATAGIRAATAELGVLFAGVFLSGLGVWLLGWVLSLLAPVGHPRAMPASVRALAARRAKTSHAKVSRRRR